MTGRFYEEQKGSVFHICRRAEGNGQLVFLCGRRAARARCRLHPGIPSTMDVCERCLDICRSKEQGLVSANLGTTRDADLDGLRDPQQRGIVNSRRFTDQRPRLVTERDLKRRWDGGKPGERFRCYLCGHRFKLGEYWRWIYAIPRGVCNFSVCEACDGDDVIDRWVTANRELRERFWWGPALSGPEYMGPGDG